MLDDPLKLFVDMVLSSSADNVYYCTVLMLPRPLRGVSVEDENVFEAAWAVHVSKILFHVWQTIIRLEYEKG